MLFIKVEVKVFRKEDFFELVFLIIMIFINGIFGVRGIDNVKKLVLNFCIIYN